MMMTHGSHPFMAELQDARELVEEIIDQMKEKLPAACGLRVNSVALGGSLGLGICHSRSYDCEITLYSPDIDQKEMEKNGCGFWLNKIDQLFQKDPTLSLWYGCPQVLEQKLEFMLQELVEVHLILSPWWGRPDHFYTFIETIRPQTRNKFYLCAAKWQMQFLKQQPNQDQRKELTRRATAWRDQRWVQSAEARGRPSTYLLTLLVLRAYENALKRLGVFSSLSPDTMAHHTTEELKKIVYNHETIDIWWEHCYSLRQYPTLVSPSPPRILDPANPANNLYITGVTPYAPKVKRGERKGGDGHWMAMRKHIDSLDLSMPVM